jgi:hypothetical protein
MNTQTRLQTYHNLVRSGKAEEANNFVDENQHDKRFMSLIELRIVFLKSLKKALK